MILQRGIYTYTYLVEITGGASKRDEELLLMGVMGSLITGCNVCNKTSVIPRNSANAFINNTHYTVIMN